VLPKALQSEKLRTQKELTEKLRLENEITRGDVLRRTEVARTFALIADAMATRINSASELPRTVREDLLRELATWPLALEEASHATTRRKAAKTEEKES
jgi:hypothetical protein